MDKKFEVILTEYILKFKLNKNKIYFGKNVFLILKFNSLLHLLFKFQLNLWDAIQRINPVWYFDATGKVFVNLDDENDHLLYSIVCHDHVSLSNLIY